MSEWNTDFVRCHMSVDGIGAPSDANRNRFDRWLAEHDRKVAAKTLRDASKDIYLPSGGPSTYVDINYAEHLVSLYLKDRAEQIEEGAEE